MPESVVVIGCGPGGMFFCHAMEARYRELKEKGDTEALLNLPNITVFERADSPGGVWRSHRSHADSSPISYSEEKKEIEPATQTTKSTQMYEALWSNGPKEGVELWDYTFDEHFSESTPVYLPRQALLEYMVARVIRKSPDFFEKYVTFNTSVSKVVFNDDEQNFTVTTQNLLTGTGETKIFDRCIWAAGDNGVPNMPKAALDKLSKFSGRIIHSTDTNNFKNDVCGKRIAIIGGSYSAEDLALMACKVGAEKIYIIARSGESVVGWHKVWPNNKVEVLLEWDVVEAESGSTIVVQKAIDNSYLSKSFAFDKKVDPRRLENIDTIILCTGYKHQHGMLEPRLSQWKNFDLKNATITVPDDWEVEENETTKKGKTVLGDHPRPEKAYWGGSFQYYPGIYNGILIDNPKMMFLRTDHEYPILNIDSLSWLFMQYITGGVEMPSPEEMTRRLEEKCLTEMSRFPYARYYMDPSYRDLIVKKDKNWAFYYESYIQHSDYDFHCMAYVMSEGKYPSNIGTYGNLNERGIALKRYGDLSYKHRVSATEDKTFRDIEDAHEFKSIFTGTVAVPLNKTWLDINEEEDKNLW
mmetsp:Transcript_37294/g.42601  ORF Transcript_37294/g.42601 Transcript_37294/m.42601 type:complete len:583 (-) Transcript_37294:92-1840(-)|eukprot:CAMPEP_0194147198 /NCGR_PEP_ID=MMETSP0152-20130528/22582_1 /TAXON_ID=1049557 /ORGANISM="Thalassiothrix antarctica, Strain L6-D1" /LENGTH=582 /DNA_ID=CAMNT_0038847909 /DNA_START=93 /DNA_END=1838 /DNA_ORIENTATION=+